MKYLKLQLQEAKTQCGKLSKHLHWSLQRVKCMLPFQGETLDHLSPEDLEQVDAFCMRFGKLQDMLGRQLFRSVLIVEQEEVLSMLDILHAMEKRKILESSEQWGNIRTLRNRLAHDYPEGSEERADALNSITDYTPALLKIYQCANNYISEKDLI